MCQKRKETKEVTITTTTAIITSNEKDVRRDRKRRSYYLYKYETLLCVERETKEEKTIVRIRVRLHDKNTVFLWRKRN